MENKPYYFIVPITFRESDGVPFIDVPVVESIAPYVSDNEKSAKNIAKIYEKHFNQPFGVVELKSVVGGENANELKPCPFCGSTDIKFAAFDAEDEGSVICMMCKKCEACGPIVDPMPNNGYFEEQQATDAWNRRAGRR